MYIYHQFIIACAIFLIFCSIAIAGEVPRDPKILSIADIHFDPFNGCERAKTICDLAKQLQQAPVNQWESIFEANLSDQFSKMGQDTNYPLLKSTLSEIKQVNDESKPQFAMMLGDWIAHNLRTRYILYTGDMSQKGYEKFVYKLYQFLTNELKKNFPSTTIYSVLGNNDSYTGDYSTLPKGKFLQETMPLLRSLIQDSANRALFAAEYPTAGYYSVVIPHTTHRVIVLNTTLFSSYAMGRTIHKTAERELTWLEDQLIEAEKNQQTVLIAFHIPFGIDVFNTLKNQFKFIHTFWKDKYTKQFQAILERHPEIVSTIDAAHIHKDAFQELTLNHRIHVSVLMTPSISPIYFNNPGFKVYDYDDQTFKMKDATVYYLALTANATWEKEYTFDEIYQPHCQSCDLLKGIEKVTTDDLPGFCQKYFQVGVEDPLNTNPNTMPYFRCGIKAFTYERYKSCLCSAE